MRYKSFLLGTLSGLRDFSTEQLNEIFFQRLQFANIITMYFFERQKIWSVYFRRELKINEMKICYVIRIKE